MHFFTKDVVFAVAVAVVVFYIGARSAQHCIANAFDSVAFHVLVASTEFFFSSPFSFADLTVERILNTVIENVFIDICCFFRTIK